MKLALYNRLRKCMMQTTSDNDAEALTSLRAANRILADAGIDWNRVFDRTISVVAEFEAAPEDDVPVEKERQADVREIDEAFDAIFARDPRGSFADFIESLHDQWKTKRFLTPKQRRALFDAAEKAA